jgi:hypothetical protein
MPVFGFTPASSIARVVRHFGLEKTKMLYRTPQIAPVSAFACCGGRPTLPFIRPPPFSLSKEVLLVIHSSPLRTCSK